MYVCISPVLEQLAAALGTAELVHNHTWISICLYMYTIYRCLIHVYVCVLGTGELVRNHARIFICTGGDTCIHIRHVSNLLACRPGGFYLDRWWWSVHPYETPNVYLYMYWVNPRYTYTHAHTLPMHRICSCVGLEGSTLMMMMISLPPRNTYCLCVFCVGPPCGPPLRWWVLCGALPSVWVPCGWGPSSRRAAFHVASTRVMSRARAHAPAYLPPPPHHSSWPAAAHTDTETPIRT